jgi:glycine cleavage system H protein
MEGYKIDKDALYSKNHIWIKKVKDNLFRIGISDFVQRSLSKIEHINTLPIGSKVKKGDTIGEVEALKHIIDIISPITGYIININKEIMNDPELITHDPYQWILEMEAKQEEEIESLMSSQRYLNALIKCEIDIFTASFLNKFSLRYVKKRLEKRK